MHGCFHRQADRHTPARQRQNYLQFPALTFAVFRYFDLLKTSFVFGKIAKDNNVTINDQDIENEFAKIAENYKMDVETVKKALEGRVNELANNIFMSKIHDLLVNSNNLK